MATNHLYLYCKGNWWLDRAISKDEGGLHDFYAVAGIGYQF